MLKQLNKAIIEQVIAISESERLRSEEENTQGISLIAQLGDLMRNGCPVKTKIASLTNEERYELTALMWLGRGAEGEEVKDWEHLVSNARSMFSDLPEYLSSKGVLAEYLREGLIKLGV